MLALFGVKQKTRILIIGDEPDFVSILEYRLQLANYTVMTASTEEAGLELAAMERPNLILLDTNMPAMRGQEMLGCLCADPALKHIPMVVLAARHEDEDILPSARGTSDCITKPFDFGQLVDRIQAALKNARNEECATSTGAGTGEEA